MTEHINIADNSSHTTLRMTNVIGLDISTTLHFAQYDRTYYISILDTNN